MTLINKILWLAIVFEYVFSLLLKYSLSNSNYFMSAKKMLTWKMYNRFWFYVGKNGICVAKCIFPNIQLKDVVNRLPPFKNL